MQPYDLSKVTQGLIAAIPFKKDLKFPQRPQTASKFEAYGVFTWFQLKNIARQNL